MIETYSGRKAYPRRKKVWHKTVSFNRNRILRLGGQFRGRSKGGVTDVSKVTVFTISIDFQ